MKEPRGGDVAAFRRKIHYPLPIGFGCQGYRNLLGEPHECLGGNESSARSGSFRGRILAFVLGNLVKRLGLSNLAAFFRGDLLTVRL